MDYETTQELEKLLTRYLVSKLEEKKVELSTAEIMAGASVLNLIREDIKNGKIK